MSDEADAHLREHALYFMRLAEDAETHLTGAREVEWLDRLEEEHDNIMSALRWAGGSGESENIEIGLRIVGATWRFWNVRGHINEVSEELQGLLSQAALLGCSKEVRAKALNGAGSLAFIQSNNATALSLAQDAISLSREVGDNKSIAVSLSILGHVAFVQGDYLTARSQYEESLLLRKELGDKSGIAGSLGNLGHVASIHLDYTTARSLNEQGLAIMRELGHKSGVAAFLHDLGTVTYMQRDYTAARSFYEQGLAIMRELGYKSGISWSLFGLGKVAYMQEDFSTARTLYEQGLTIMSELGDKRGIASFLTMLGFLATYVEGDYATAGSLHLESLKILRESGYKLGMAINLVGLGWAAVSDAQPQRGVRLLVGSDALYDEIDVSRDHYNCWVYERAIVAARFQLGEEGLEKAIQEARAKGRTQSIINALEEA